MTDFKAIGEKLAKLLYEDDYRPKGCVNFDFRSYDDEEYVPHLFIDGVRYDVEMTYLSEDGTELSVTTLRDGKYWDYTFYLDFRADEDHEFADNEEDYNAYLEKMGAYGLLQDMYYELPVSWEIGDFEMDFLKIY